ncbi:hypothetical protein HY631_00535 [Candidatus Uhrbacteria bacterium]|nr:hypothetical protein [Candidatus Uhrbacteria bacterium]
MSTPSSATKHACLVGCFIVLLYAICLIFPLIYPYGADVLAFHALSLKLAFPGFQGLTLGSIVWGGVLSFAYGFLASLLFHSFHRGCCQGK